MAEHGPSRRPGDPPGALVAALERLLRPLVRLLIAHGITYPFLTALLKSVYVDVAARDFALPRRPQTDSRITLLTGVHRKDVKRLRGGAARRFRPPPGISLNAQMVALWAGAPEFLDADGRPRPLPRHAAGPGEPSFDTLVEAVSKDIRPRAVLDEWLRLGLAREGADGLLRLSVEAFIPREGFDELAYYFGRNVHDHIAAGAHNLMGGEPPFLERSVYYDRLTPESAMALAKLAEEAGMRVLVEINKEALKRAEADDGKPGARRRINFGIYFYGADQPGPEKPDSEGSTAGKPETEGEGG